jgi:hypothetical protein
MESFLAICKQNYLEGITPSNPLSKNKEGYQKAVAVAKYYFDNGRYDDFAGYFVEGQYFISLWAAHMLVEYGHPNEELMSVAIKTIIDYSQNPLAPEVADEEKQWMAINSDRCNKYL